MSFKSKPQGYKTFYMLNSAEHEISTAIELKLKYWKIVSFLAVKLLVCVFILLINVKIKINCSHFNIYEEDKFCAQLSWAWKKFYNLGACFTLCTSHIHVYMYMYITSAFNSLLIR